MNLRYYFHWLLLILCFVLSSCENIIGGQGKIIDKEGKPIKDAIVTLYIDGDSVESTISDSVGFFSESRLVGCVPNCPEGSLKITKNGYSQIFLDIDDFQEKNDTILDLDNLLIRMK